MPLPTASDILRRIQDTIYTPSLPRTISPSPSPHPSPILDSQVITSTSRLHDRSASSAIQAETAISNSDWERTQQTEENQTLQNAAGLLSSSATEQIPSSASHSSSSSSLNSSQSHELDSPRSSRNAGGRRRQSSIPTSASPDVNAQSVLRRRILEIQQLDIDEREKARRVQVSSRQVNKAYTLKRN